jgi:hypothetical protein
VVMILVATWHHHLVFLGWVESRLLLRLIVELICLLPVAASVASVAGLRITPRHLEWWRSLLLLVWTNLL